MRAILGFIFIFTILADFTLSCADESTNLSIGAEISCINGDIDHPSDKSSNKHESEDHHCHCHVGHVHTTVFLNHPMLGTARSSLFNLVYPEYISNYANNFLSELTRPPIA